MRTDRSRIRERALIVAGVWFALVEALMVQPVFAQNKVIATYTFPDIPIKEFHNKTFPGSVANDRKVLLGSIGSDLWRGPKIRAMNSGC
jgi:hypothetical protein